MRRLLLPLLLAAAAGAAPDRAEITAKVTYLVPEGAYVEAGSDQGLAAGETGTVLRDGRPVAKAEIVAVSSRSARVRVFDGDIRLGDLVQFEAVAAPKAPEAPPDQAPKKPEAAEPFVPLLEKQKATARVSSPRNVSHGWVTLNQYVQTGSDEEFFRTTLSSAGDIQRLWGKPWAFDWSFNLSGRGGDAFSDSALEGARLDVYELALSRRLGESGLLRLGRFVPRALPSVGYVDGGLVEQRLAPHLRGGAILGFAPTVDELVPSLDAPMAVLYGTLDAGDRKGDRFTGTLGALGSLYEGDMDRFAAVFDMFGRVGILDLSADGVVDFDVGSQQFTSGTRLTELNADLTARLAKGTRLRAGTDHYENLDTAAERAGLPYLDPLVFEGSGWRYYVGGTQNLPARLTLDVTVNFIDAPDTGDTTNWYASLTKYGVFGSDVASVSLSVYSLEGFDVEGLGGRLTAYVPLGKLTLQGGVGFTAFDPDVATEFDVTDVNFFASYQISRKWTVQGGVTAAIGDSADYVGFDAGVTYRW
ncbi:MAG: hypothetical protein L6Q95_01105 [Planctomycetes bacterium]|nr:hypothetical protein [Planctomycetota bacterium]